MKKTVAVVWLIALGVLVFNVANSNLRNQRKDPPVAPSPVKVESALEGTRIIKPDSWTGDWNVPSAVAELRCREGRKLSVMFNGKEYALNAAARADYTPAFFTLHETAEGRSGLEDEEEAALALCDGQRLRAKRLYEKTVESAPDNAKIDRHSWTGSWSFTSESAELLCHQGMQVTAIVNGTEYALNGLAQKRFPSVRPVWRDNPNIPGSKVDIGDEIEAGLKLCS